MVDRNDIEMAISDYVAANDLEIVLDEVEAFIEQAYDAGRDENYDEAFNEGFEMGKEEGYDAGYEDGKAVAEAKVPTEG